MAPKQKFFKTVRIIGLILAAISTPLLAAPVTLPAVVIQIAVYITVLASVATAISQVATMEEKPSGKTRNKQE